jgi:glycerate kinase
MRVVVATDSFKHALAAPAACAAIAAGLRATHADAAVEERPLSDGGQGALEVLAQALALGLVGIDAVDPLGRPIRAAYGLSAGDGLAVIETARACGLELLAPEERDPLAASTFGAGLLLKDAIARGARRVLLAIGGSATTDAGIGMAAALGWRFLGADGAALAPNGAALLRIARIVAPPPRDLPAIEVLCDVAAPLFGPEGAAFVYAPQKGADAAAVAALDAGLRAIDALLAKPGLAETPGAGAAGGLGFGAAAFLGARLVRGADRVMDLVGLDAALAHADLVVTGEGRLDAQTAQGKLIAALCARARGFGVPVVALCGQVEASAQDIRALGLSAAIEISPRGIPPPTALAETAANLTRAAAALDLKRYAKA